MLPQFGLVLLLSHPTWSQEINPGLKVQLSEKGLENVKQFAMVNLEALLPTLSIPDMYGTTYMAGEVKYCVTQIQITKFNISNVVLNLLPGTGIQVSISNSQATITNKWKIDSWAIKTSGSSILNLNRISLTAIVVFSSNSAGLPSISLTNCNSDVKDIAVKLNGGISVVNKMMMDHMKTLTRKKMNEQLCLMLIDQIDKWSDKLGEMNFQINLNENIGFDYSPVSTPVITKDDLTLPLKGMFYSRRKPEDIAFSPAPFSLPVLKDNMLCAGVSESVFNSAMHSSFISNAFTLNLDTLVPEGLDVTNNSALAYAFPEAAKQKYPMTGIVKATDAPLVTLKPNNMTIEVALSAQVFAILPNSVQKWLATYNMDASISANLSIQSSDAALYLFGTVTVNRLQVWLANTKTKGNTSGVSEVENAIRNMTEQGLLKTLNDQLRTGVSLPNVPYFSITKPSFNINQGFIMICGDGDLVVISQQ